MKKNSTIELMRFLGGNNNIFISPGSDIRFWLDLRRVLFYGIWILYMRTHASESC